MPPEAWTATNMVGLAEWTGTLAARVADTRRAVWSETKELAMRGLIGEDCSPLM